VKKDFIGSQNVEKIKKRRVISREKRGGKRPTQREERALGRMLLKREKGSPPVARGFWIWEKLITGEMELEKEGEGRERSSQGEQKRNTACINEKELRQKKRRRVSGEEQGFINWE